MGRLTARSPVTRIAVVDDEVTVRRRADTLAVEEPLEIRVAGAPLTVTMRTPGHDVELAAGFLVSEGVIGAGGDFLSAIHCGGPGTGGGAPGTVAPLLTIGSEPPASVLASGNTYNVLDVTLRPGLEPLLTDIARNFYTTSSCGVCGAASIEAIEKTSRFDVAADAVTVDAALLLALPDRLRAGQAVFEKTGGLHAAALFDAVTGELLVLREDVGRHNAVDKVIGWAALDDRLPLSGAVLQVSGRASFELVQKAVMAGIPILSAVSAPSSLAVELAAASGLTLAGFVRGSSMNVYARPERVIA
ncbi:formate dehydrogenase accessory sulfurtransferase FdhD [Microbacterium sp. TPD7012]|uniref:formate dehydrogenase accessory sulfurtransferase FdhD n=1 Tax=unclassified Microbacterium TaxID=2609290 RepID=UPI000D514119|nr:formate dehydrogenase accessory sulfurtransferase FdhD [Microbacterium sp. TPD7012]PVE93957.1 formate dehydrogenase accessory sulfurtransferase FdhD [Microbacterium sp. TPD7012]